jgi:hypothetical protein
MANEIPIKYYPLFSIIHFGVFSNKDYLVEKVKGVIQLSANSLLQDKKLFERQLFGCLELFTKRVYYYIVFRACRIEILGYPAIYKGHRCVLAYNTYTKITYVNHKYFLLPALAGECTSSQGLQCRDIRKHIIGSAISLMENNQKGFCMNRNRNHKYDTSLVSDWRITWKKISKRT